MNKIEIYSTDFFLKIFKNILEQILGGQSNSMCGCFYVITYFTCQVDVSTSDYTIIHILYNKRKRTFETQTFITHHPRVLCFRSRRWSTGVVVALDSIIKKILREILGEKR